MWVWQVVNVGVAGDLMGVWQQVMLLYLIVFQYSFELVPVL